MNWVKSSKCEASGCVEVAWAKSSKCSDGTCVEVGHDAHGMILVRNNQAPADIVSFTQDEWVAFIAGVRNGEFDA